MKKYKKIDLNKVMKNEFRHLIEEQCNELLKLLQKLKSCLMEHLVPGNRSNILWTKIECEYDMFNTISSIEGTRRNVKK